MVVVVMCLLLFRIMQGLLPQHAKARDSNPWWQGAVLLLAGGCCFAYRRHYVLKTQLEQLQALLAHEQEKRAADRTGRIKAEQQLKRLCLDLAVAQAQQEQAAQQQKASPPVPHQGVSTASPGQGSTGSSSSSSRPTGQPQVFPLTAIGTLRSCFTHRTGTPRQPHLVPAARSVLQLAPGVPAGCLEGLEQFSHCWVLYVFHENTDLAKLMAARAGGSSNAGGGSGRSAHAAGVKSHIKVPRLNGGKMGVLATRSPHRPVPVGLSTAQVLDVDPVAGVLVLGGADIVDGSPVLDIKPYVPFSDALVHATTPPWVEVESLDEPLALGGVSISTEAATELAAAWNKGRQQSLYRSVEDFVQLVQQVLARDIRSLHQRTSVLPVQQQQQQQQHYQQQQAGSNKESDGAAITRSQSAKPKQLHQQRRQQRQLQQQGEADAQLLQGSSGSSSSSSPPGPRYVVVLEGVSISYAICQQTGQVQVCGASRCPPQGPAIAASN